MYKAGPPAFQRAYPHNRYPMTNSSKNFRVDVGIIVLALLAAAGARGQTNTEPEKVNFCDVVASATEYDGKLLSIRVILSPSEHALYLYAEACVPKEGYNVTTEAILPPGWESLPSGKKLRAILKRGRQARVEVIGIFKNDEQPYGPHPARFRFSISQVNSVSKDAAKAARIGRVLGAPAFRSVRRDPKATTP